MWLASLPPESLADVDTISEEFGYGTSFPYTLIMVPPTGVSALSTQCFSDVYGSLTRLVADYGVELTSLTDFSSVAVLGVRLRLFGQCF